MKEKANATFSIAEDVRSLLDRHEEFGYANKTAMVEAAVRRLCNDPSSIPMDRTALEQLVQEFVNAQIRRQKEMLVVEIRRDVQEAVLQQIESAHPHLLGLPSAEDIAADNEPAWQAQS